MNRHQVLGQDVSTHPFPTPALLSDGAPCTTGVPSPETSRPPPTPRHARSSPPRLSTPLWSPSTSGPVPGKSSGPNPRARAPRSPAGPVPPPSGRRGPALDASVSEGPAPGRARGRHGGAVPPGSGREGSGRDHGRHWHTTTRRPVPQSPGDGPSWGSTIVLPVYTSLARGLASLIPRVSGKLGVVDEQALTLLPDPFARVGLTHFNQGLRPVWIRSSEIKEPIIF